MTQLWNAPRQVAVRFSPGSGREHHSRDNVQEPDLATPAHFLLVRPPSSAGFHDANALPHRGSDHKARVIPKSVQAALDAQRFDVSVECFGIVPNLLDNPNGPIAIKGEHSAQIL